MMAIQDPGTRRHRRFGLASLMGLGLLLAGGGWAAAGARTDYVLLVVDARSGEVVSRTAPGELRLGEAADRILRAAAGSLADRLAAYARGTTATPRPSAAPVAPPSTGLRIELVDAWAMPDAPPPLAGGPVE